MIRAHPASPRAQDNPRRAIRWAAIGVAAAAGLILLAVQLEPGHRTGSDTDRDAVRIVRGAWAPAPAPASVREATLPDDTGPFASSGPIVPDEVSQLEQLLKTQPRDAAAVRAEALVRKAALTHLPEIEAAGLHVACSITLCRIAGTASGDGGAVRRALRAEPFLSALADGGYSAGADGENKVPAGTGFVFFVNRET